LKSASSRKIYRRICVAKNINGHKSNRIEGKEFRVWETLLLEAWMIRLWWVASGGTIKLYEVSISHHT
jgi:hypothetical protein